MIEVLEGTVQQCQLDEVNKKVTRMKATLETIIRQRAANDQARGTLQPPFVTEMGTENIAAQQKHNAEREYMLASIVEAASTNENYCQYLNSELFGVGEDVDTLAGIIDDMDGENADIVLGDEIDRRLRENPKALIPLYRRWLFSDPGVVREEYDDARDQGFIEE